MRKRTPLHYAARHGHLEIAEYLIAKGANKENRDSMEQYTPLREAVINRRYAVTKLLLDKVRISMQLAAIMKQLYFRYFK